MRDALMFENQKIEVTPIRNNQNQWMATMDVDKTIGTLLREARENKGHSLKKISQHTKINLTILEALEEDRLEKLPNKAYVVGFVKAYAHLVDLNPLDCIETLNRTYSRGATQKPKRIRSQLLKSDGSQENSPVLAMGLALVVLVLIGFTVIFLNSHREKIVQKPVVITQNLTESTPLKIEGTQGLSLSAQKAASESVTKIVEESTMREMSIAPPEVVFQEQLLHLDLQEHKPMISLETTTALKSPVTPEVVQTISAPAVIPVTPSEKEPVAPAVKFEAKTDGVKEINFRPMTDVMYTYTEEGSSEALAKYVPKNIQNSIIKNKQNVYITAVDGDTWLTYKRDQDPIKRFTLPKNKSILIRGDEIRIFLGNANVTRIFLNNKQLDILSKNGIKSLVIPKENASKYQFPLFIYDQGQTFTSDEFIKLKGASTTP